MARFSKYFFLLTSSIILLTSCQEGKSAGDLLGQWRLTGKDNMYVSFSGAITQFHKNNDQSVFGQFQHVGDSLFIQCASIYQEKSDTIMVEDEFGMKPFTNIRVRIDAVDGDHLTLSKDGQRWLFEKY
jgi:hypothetical protein